jgi:hypothetical protein
MNGVNPVAFTIFTKNYLAQARCLAESIRQSQAQLPLVALLVDDPSVFFDPQSESFEILRLTDLSIPDARALVFETDQQGACCLLKPFMLRHLLARGFSPVVFLDPDILVLDPLEELIETAGGAAISLTPNWLTPRTGADAPRDELRMLLGGTFNGGVLAVSDRPQALAFLSWWETRLRIHCRHAPAEGVHYDQRWLDLVPSLFDEVHVLRDPGLNVAYWNLAERSLRLEGGRAYVEGDVCRAFHFSGYSPAAPDRMTRFEEFALPPVSMAAAAPLFDAYREALLRNGWSEASRWPYSAATFDNGVHIAPIVREIYRRLRSRIDFGDPFDCSGPASFYNYLCSCAEDRSAPRLWKEIHERRPDLQAAFPDIDGNDLERFANWVRIQGEVELAIPRAMIDACAHASACAI